MTHGFVAYNGPSEPPSQSHRRKRKPVNCEECRRSKLRCDRQHPCAACKRRKREVSCSYRVSSVGHEPTQAPATPSPTAASAGPSSSVQHPSTLRPNRTNTSPLQPQVQSEETVQSPPHTHWETVLERPAPESESLDAWSPFSIAQRIPIQEIMQSLPPRPCCDYLISHFFNNISSLFPILHGPTFQKQYFTFMQHPEDIDLPWLALLFAICCLALSTMDENDPRLVSLWPLLSPDAMQASATQVPATISVSRLLLRSAMTCLLQDNFMFRHEFSTFEALLMVIYCLSHNESVEQGWGLLGMALNIGVALRCNIDQNLSPIQTERRRRCWAGLLTLHTYQGMLFRDVDMSYLLDIKATPPADINDSDVTDEGVLQSPNRREPTQMSVMMAKLRLFRLSIRICRHISGPSRLDQCLLNEFDAEIAAEQSKWDSMYMVDGSPNILDPNGYAYWCVLQTYAYHLYLLLHRPFHHSKSPSFLATSRDKCISSSVAMISIHKQLYEAPLLRNFLWLLSGVTSLKALHAAVALNSCIQDLSTTVDTGYDLDSFRAEIGTLTLRMKDLSGRSKICSRAYQVLDHLQTHPGSGNTLVTSMRSEIENLFEDWADVREWLDTNMVNWNMDEILG